MIQKVLLQTKNETLTGGGKWRGTKAQAVFGNKFTKTPMAHLRVNRGAMGKN